MCVYIICVTLLMLIVYTVISHNHFFSHTYFFLLVFFRNSKENCSEINPINALICTLFPSMDDFFSQKQIAFQLVLYITCKTAN